LTKNNSIQNTVKETTVNRSRRKALKTIPAGTAAAGAMVLTNKWSKSVVDTVILPAHAQATNGGAPVGSITPARPPLLASTARYWGLAALR